MLEQFLIDAKFPWNYVMLFLAANMAAGMTLFAYGTYLDWKKPKSRS